MKNRPPSSPIQLVALLSFVLVPLFLARAEPGVPTSNIAPAPAAPSTTTKSTPSAASPASAASITEGATTYTVVLGDSLWLIAHKSGCTVAALERVNNVKKTTLLHPGQVLKLPPPKAEKSTTPTLPPAAPAPAAKPDAAAPTYKPTGHHKMYAKAQPVQDFDIPASTFASCPVPLAHEEDVDAPSPATPDTAVASAPVAKLVSPSEMTSEPASDIAASIPVTNSATKASRDYPSVASAAPVAPAPKPASHGFNPFSFFTKPSIDWASRFLQEARVLGSRGIEYDEDWRPPGESQSWTMDCSNTSRYLYKVTAGIELPRTASDQYYYLHLQNKAWDAPQAVNGYADCNYLRQNLKPGDLLFWENTYRPERQPPITHVMVFLGTNEKNQWIMAGSQTSRGGEHNRRNGGPDIYVFDPTQPCGGYTTWLGLVHHQGRFCAFGRPLEADRSKLAVAANN